MNECQSNQKKMAFLGLAIFNATVPAKNFLIVGSTNVRKIAIL